jgi:hypothetical protein
MIKPPNPQFSNNNNYYENNKDDEIIIMEEPPSLINQLSSLFKKSLLTILIIFLVFIISLSSWRYYEVRRNLLLDVITNSDIKHSQLKKLTLTCVDHPELCDVPLLHRPPPLIDRPGRWRRALVDAELQYDQPGERWLNYLWGKFSLKQWSYVSTNSPKYFIAVLLVKFSYIGEILVYVVDKQQQHQQQDSSSGSTSRFPVYMYTARRPLGSGLTFSHGSAGGCTSWGIPQHKPEINQKPWIEMCGRGGDGGFRVRASVQAMLMKQQDDGSNEMLVSSLSSSDDNDDTTKKIPILFDSTFEGPGIDQLTIVYPLGGHIYRPQYIHKSAGNEVSEGYIQVGTGNDKYQLGGGIAVAGLDWTKGYALTRTTWRWVFLNDPKAKVVYHHHHHLDDSSHVVQPNNTNTIERLGINLSQDVYDIISRKNEIISTENGIWLNGKLYVLHHHVDIVNPPPTSTNNNNKGTNSFKQKWYIKTTKATNKQSQHDDHDVEFIDLTFTPYGGRKDYTDYGLVVSQFEQPFGQFTGTITLFHADYYCKVTIELSNEAFGVVENHLAVW